MSRLENRIRKLEKIKSAKEQKIVVWIVGQETKEKAMEKAGVQESDDFLLSTVVFVSPQEKTRDY
jgi:Trk K+ transport system NAD-binding subunit